MPETVWLVEAKAGPHDRFDCPVRFRVPGCDSKAAYHLVGNDGSDLALQRSHAGEFTTVVPLLRSGRSAKYLLSLVCGDHVPHKAVHLQHADGSHIDVCISGELLTRYVYADVPARPFFYPVRGPFGVDVTRSYPMATDVRGEPHDHRHHRSLWIAHGNVDGTDNWSEEPGHGFTTHTGVDEIISGPIYGRFVASGLWATSDRTPILRQKLTVTAWGTGGSIRLMDVDVDLTAEYGPVTFGDTKEGGILAARVASSLDVPRGGKIENSVGGIDEAETWGRAAHWCDYSGTADGQRIGLAILDHPTSFRHPTTWHVRNYGLMTANPFGYSAFTNGLKIGGYTTASGETLSFRYRVVIHVGDAREANIAGHYANYACPPEVSVTACDGI